MGVEPETREFLLRIVSTISAIVLWMVIHVFIGIYLEYAFYDPKPTWKNLIYYAFVLITLFYLVKYLRKKWKDQLL